MGANEIKTLLKESAATDTVEFDKGLLHLIGIMIDDNSALKSSLEVLMKVTNLGSKVFPEKYRTQIIKNLRDTSKKIEKIVSKLK